MTDWTDINSWKEFAATADSPISSPFEKTNLNPASVYLYSQETAPLPSAVLGGNWYSYPSVGAMAAHIRHALLPSMFGTWLCRGDWDDDEGPILLEELFQQAAAHESSYVDDIPLMREITALIDKAISTDNYDSAEQACNKFNVRWARTSTWDFELVPFSSLQAVASHISEMAAENFIEPEDWQSLIEKVFVDVEAEETVRDAIANSYVI